MSGTWSRASSLEILLGPLERALSTAYADLQLEAIEAAQDHSIADRPPAPAGQQRDMSSRKTVPGSFRLRLRAAVPSSRAIARPAEPAAGTTVGLAAVLVVEGPSSPDIVELQAPGGSASVASRVAPVASSASTPSAKHGRVRLRPRGSDVASPTSSMPRVIAPSSAAPSTATARASSPSPEGVISTSEGAIPTSEGAIPTPYGTFGPVRELAPPRVVETIPPPRALALPVEPGAMLAQPRARSAQVRTRRRVDMVSPAASQDRVTRTVAPTGGTTPHAPFVTFMGSSVRDRQESRSAAPSPGAAATPVAEATAAPAVEPFDERAMTDLLARAARRHGIEI